MLAILTDFQKKGIKLNPPINKDTCIIGFSYASLNGLSKGGDLPEMHVETDVEKSIGIMVDFLEKIAFPLLDKFEDLREIDKLVNGEDPWKTDWGMQYSLGGNFHLKRLIISKLAGLDSYDKTLNFIRKDYASQFNDKYGDVYRKALSDVEELNKVLMDVKPLY